MRSTIYLLLMVTGAMLVALFSPLADAAPPGNEVPGLKLPADVRGEVGDWITVTATTDGKTVRWVPLDANLRLFPVELLKDSRTAVAHALKPGTYRLLAYTAIAGEPTAPAVCTVTVGASPQPPNPPPDPPPVPSDGFRVLLIYETAEVQRLTPAQSAVLFGKAVRDYLDAKCVVGSDGRTKEWRVWDKDTDPAAAGVTLQSMFKRPRQSVPWIVISTDKGGYEGPLPKDVPTALALLKQYGGE